MIGKINENRWLLRLLPDSSVFMENCDTHGAKINEANLRKIRVVEANG